MEQELPTRQVDEGKVSQVRPRQLHANDVPGERDAAADTCCLPYVFLLHVNKGLHRLILTQDRSLGPPQHELDLGLVGEARAEVTLLDGEPAFGPVVLDADFDLAGPRPRGVREAALHRASCAGACVARDTDLQGGGTTP